MVKKIVSKSVLSLLTLVMTFGASVSIAFADKYDDQINNLNQQSSQNQAQIDSLQTVANDYQSAINALANEINGVQAALNQSLARQTDLEQKIAENQIKIEKSRVVLGDNLKKLYLEGQMSSMEMLATSNNLSDYVDKEEYRNVIQSQVKNTLTQVQALQAEQQKQKSEVEGLIKDQQAQRSDLTAKKAQQSQMLAYNQQQQDSYTAKIKANNAEVQKLRAAQAAENAGLSNGTPGVGVNCGGGYPGSTNGPWGKWGCYYPLDNTIDNWGMYNRECVSYTAFKVASSGRYMPYWGGRGNANQWDDNARAAGIPVDRNPKAGDVAVKNSGTYGHVMYVEYVWDDGSILVSDYNQQWDGAYRQYVVSASKVQSNNLVFIHFPY